MNFFHVKKLIEEYKLHFGEKGPAATLALYAEKEIDNAIRKLENENIHLS